MLGDECDKAGTLDLGYQYYSNIIKNSYEDKSRRRASLPEVNKITDEKIRSHLGLPLPLNIKNKNPSW